MFQSTKDEWRELITICDKLPDGVKYHTTGRPALHHRNDQAIWVEKSELKALEWAEADVPVVNELLQLWS